ncbi:ADP-dependent glucokinase [Solemya velum gill symbiont]|uniref:ADP-dependent glucokinase n=1 Tax=Solemya velum gill symbiont TaxID=2340 RepID=A0A0B0H964_SOVGS|nr:ADP-dependent glucokinase [Solemya velum gill symbiont]
MNNLQIECIVRENPVLSRYVVGVFSTDNLPKYVSARPSAYICNTDPSDLSGQHWVVFWFEDATRVEFFDSFGHDPIYYSLHFTRFWTVNADICYYNSVRVQRNDSDTCGHHVLYYLSPKSRRVSMTRLIDTLVTKGDPDDFVRGYVARNTRCL